MHLLALLSIFTDQNDRFPDTSYTLIICEIPNLFKYLKPEKGTAFGRSLPAIGHYREYPTAVHCPVHF